jgi:hypothetical protein
MINVEIKVLVESANDFLYRDAYSSTHQYQDLCEFHRKFHISNELDLINDFVEKDYSVTIHISKEKLSE